jgi:hypothetical protein
MKPTFATTMPVSAGPGAPPPPHAVNSTTNDKTAATDATGFATGRGMDPSGLVWFRPPFESTDE